MPRYFEAGAGVLDRQQSGTCLQGVPARACALALPLLTHGASPGAPAPAAAGGASCPHPGPLFQTLAAEWT